MYTHISSLTYTRHIELVVRKSGTRATVEKVTRHLADKFTYDDGGGNLCRGLSDPAHGEREREKEPIFTIYSKRSKALAFAHAPFSLQFLSLFLYLEVYSGKIATLQIYKIFIILRIYRRMNAL